MPSPLKSLRRPSRGGGRGGTHATARSQGASPRRAQKRASCIDGRAQTSGVIIVALTKPKAHPQPRCARSLPRGLSPAITHTHGDAQPWRPPPAQLPAAPPPPPRTQLQRPHGSRSSQNCAPQPAPGCVAHTRTQRLVPPPRRPTPCTRRTSVPLSMPHTHPLHLLASALALHLCDILHSPRRAVRCMEHTWTWTRTWHTHARPQSHASAVRHPSHTQSPPALACTTGCAHTHARLARAVDAGDAPHALRASGPRCRLLSASVPVSPTTHPSRPSPLQVVIADAPHDRA